VAREIAAIISGSHSHGGDRIAFSARFTDGTTESFVCSAEAMPLMVAVLKILGADAAVERGEATPFHIEGVRGELTLAPGLTPPN
jgi:hypothetical protein